MSANGASAELHWHMSASGPLVPALILAACTGTLLVVAVRRQAAPVWVSVMVALVLRVLFAALTSRHYTPNDVVTYFHSAGELVLQHKDPVSHLPGREWNFLELMPYVFALEIKTGLPWVYASKIFPIAADLVVTWLVYRLAPADGRSRALQYAVNPLSLLIVSLHGQVEPVALAFALGGVLLARQQHWLLAGALLGAAVAAKSWPVLILLAVIPATRPRQAASFLVGAAVVPALMLASGAIFLDTHPVSVIKHVASYTSLVQDWGWGGLLVSLGGEPSGYGTAVGHISAVLTGLAVTATLIVFRRQPAAARAAMVLTAFLIVTAAFGAQYLLWPLPLMFVGVGSRRLWYTTAAAFWASISYLSNVSAESFLAGMSWLVIAILAAVMVDVYRQGWPASREAQPKGVRDGAGATQPAGGARPSAPGFERAVVPDPA